MLVVFLIFTLTTLRRRVNKTNITELKNYTKLTSSKRPCGVPTICMNRQLLIKTHSHEMNILIFALFNTSIDFRFFTIV